MKSFNEMPLAEELKKGLASLKFITPTEIQSAVIDTALAGKDLMACAETGSGKTGAFGVPMVQTLLENPESRALIMAPTRELVHQIADFLRDLTKYCDTVNVTSLVGGADMYKQLKALKRKPRIVVATPGRLNDHIRRRSIKLDTTKILILDEGDRMLDMGFAPQLDEVLVHLPKDRHSMLFTATLPKKVKSLAADYLTSPKQIGAGRESLPVASIKQSILQINSSKEKNGKLLDELNKREGSIIIFFRTKQRVDDVTDYLDEYGFKVGLIHGDRSQGQRNRAIQNFKSGKMRILCATDVAARGIDVPSVAHVINYDLPRMDEDYVHRIGRTARNGAEGEALSFVTRSDHRAWIGLAKKYQIKGVELENVSNDASSDRPRRQYGRKRPGGGAGRSGDSGRRDRSKGPSGRWGAAKPKRRDGEGGGESSYKAEKSGPDERGNYSKRKPSSKKKSASSKGESSSRKRFTKKSAAGSKPKQKQGAGGGRPGGPKKSGGAKRRQTR